MAFNSRTINLLNSICLSLHHWFSLLTFVLQYIFPTKRDQHTVSMDYPATTSSKFEESKFQLINNLFLNRITFRHHNNLPMGQHGSQGSELLSIGEISWQAQCGFTGFTVLRNQDDTHNSHSRSQNSQTAFKFMLSV